MVPVVALHVTVTFAESPVLMNAAAVKLTVSFSCTVTFLGEMTRSAMVPPVELRGRGFSHAKTSAVARRATGNATLRFFIKANRAANLCLNVMAFDSVAWGSSYGVKNSLMSGAVAAWFG